MHVHISPTAPVPCSKVYTTSAAPVFNVLHAAHQVRNAADAEADTESGSPSMCSITRYESRRSRSTYSAARTLHWRRGGRKSCRRYNMDVVTTH